MGASSAVLSALVLPFVDLSWLGTTAGLVMALWLGLATISIAYVMFTWGLGGLTAATAATLTLGEPLTASILGHRRSRRTALGARDRRSRDPRRRARPARVGVARASRPGAVRGGGLTMPHIEIRVDDLTGEATRALIAFHLDGHARHVAARERARARHRRAAASVHHVLVGVDRRRARGHRRAQVDRCRARRAQVDARGRPLPRQRRGPSAPASHHRRGARGAA